jgi:hypothetical protein
MGFVESGERRKGAAARLREQLWQYLCSYGCIVWSFDNSIRNELDAMRPERRQEVSSGRKRI